MKRVARAPTRRAHGARFMVLTGLSGAGKSQAIRALEDLGYYCVDNLPTVLIPTLAEFSLREGAEIDKVAIVVDIREAGFLTNFARVYRALRHMPGVDPALIFLEASDETLVRRFSETRRPHPLAPDRSVSEGILEERSRLHAIRQMADLVLDTSDLNVHELRQVFMNLSRTSSARAPLVVTFLSFGFKHGVPVDADLVFDVRFLPNPHFVRDLRPLTGRNKPVIDFMRQHPETGEFIDRVGDLLRFLLPQYVREGKTYLTVGIGCTGGRHRSVMIAEALRRNLKDVGDVRTRVKHRDTGHEA